MLYFAVPLVLVLIAVPWASGAEGENEATVPSGTNVANPESLKSPLENESSEIATELQKPGVVTDAGDLEAFFDGMINSHLKTKHIAGGVVAVVAEGRLIFSKGYGYADIAARKKIDPETTLFRIGSVSKLFTWTAVMQQVEAGKLDLDTDINQYLKNVNVPATYPDPITMRHLLTHTPGFEDYVIGLFAQSADKCGPLDELLRGQMPKRVFPPGTVPAYSNFGTALAGYAVACVSGLSWEDYVEQRILQPLGMNHTWVRQPATDQLPTDLSRGYKWSETDFEVKGFEYVPDAPAGSISMSAADAAKFMIAHLNDGQLGDSRILQPETARRMREPLQRPDPHTEALGYGFILSTVNHQQVVGHNGATLWFHTEMDLLPEHGVGLFTSFNTNTASVMGDAIQAAFLDRYYPETQGPRPKSIAGFSERAKLVTGEYIMTRHSWTSVAKLEALLGAISITVNPDETLQIAFGGKGRRFAEVEPFVYQELDGPLKFVFKQGPNQQVREMYLGNAPVVAALRAEWYEQSSLHWGILIACSLLFASAVLFWPVIAYSVGGCRTFSPWHARAADYWSLIAWLQSVAGIAFIIGLLVLLGDPNEIVFGFSRNLKLLFLVPQIQLVLAIATTFGCLAVWRQGNWKPLARLHYTLVALAGIVFLGFLYYWNLLIPGSGI